MLGKFPDDRNGIDRENILFGAGDAQPCFNIRLHGFLGRKFFEVAICADALKQIRVLGFFQHSGKFHLADEQQGEKIAVVILHVRQHPDIIQNGRRYDVGFINNNNNFFALIGGFKKKTVKDFQKINFLFLETLFSGDLTDNFSQQLYERKSGVGDQGDFVFFRFQRIDNDAKRERLAKTDFTDNNGQTFIALLNGVKRFSDNIFH